MCEIFHRNTFLITPQANSLDVKQNWVKQLRSLQQQFQFGVLRIRSKFSFLFWRQILWSKILHQYLTTTNICPRQIIKIVVNDILFYFILLAMSTCSKSAWKNPDRYWIFSFLVQSHWHCLIPCIDYRLSMSWKSPWIAFLWISLNEQQAKR